MHQQNVVLKPRLIVGALKCKQIKSINQKPLPLFLNGNHFHSFTNETNDICAVWLVGIWAIRICLNFSSFQVDQYFCIGTVKPVLEAAASNYFDEIFAQNLQSNKPEIQIQPLKARAWKYVKYDSMKMKTMYYFDTLWNSLHF